MTIARTEREAKFMRELRTAVEVKASPQEVWLVLTDVSTSRARCRSRVAGLGDVALLA